MLFSHHHSVYYFFWGWPVSQRFANFVWGWKEKCVTPSQVQDGIISQIGCFLSPAPQRIFMKHLSRWFQSEADGWDYSGPDGGRNSNNWHSWLGILSRKVSVWLQTETLYIGTGGVFRETFPMDDINMSFMLCSGDYEIWGLDSWFYLRKSIKLK